MFQLLKILISGFVMLTIIAAVIYFLPREIKIKGVEKLTGIVPDSIREKAEDFLLTPPEQRERIISDLEENLEDLKNNPTQADTIIQDAKELINKLKEENEAASFTEILGNKLAQRVVNQIAGTSTQCQP